MMNETRMKIKKLIMKFTICKVESVREVSLEKEYFFLSKTDEEISLVCPLEDVPEKSLEREDGWRGFRIEGVLDFSLVGILSKISLALANNQIGLFAVSTFNTDYIFVKKENFEKALSVLENEGFEII